MRLKVLGASGVIAVAIVVPAMALAADSGVLRNRPNQQFDAWRSVQVATLSRSFLPLTGLRENVCAAGAMSATVSVAGRAAPMQLQVRIDGGALMAPGVVTFTPSSTETIAAFTFIANAQPFESNDHHQLQVEWRSLTGRMTIIRAATMSVIYQAGSHAC